MTGTHRVERLTFFSDAVFAIAMTLLVIELHVPEIHGSTDRAAWIALSHMLPNFIGFLVSFLVIGAFWINHHRAFGMVARFDARLMWPNLLFLLVIVVMPFTTALMSDYFGTRVPTLVYLANLLLAGLSQAGLLRIALRQDHAHDDIAVPEIAALRRRVWGVPIAATMAIAIALTIAPGWSIVSLASIAVLNRILGRVRA